MTLRNDISQIREQAIALRLAGKSRREIKEILGPMSNHTLDDALRGTPPPDWTRRPNAKDDRHAEARELRAQGLDYNEIAARLGVSKSSVSLWVRDMPRPPRLSYAENRGRAAEGVRRYWAKEREIREARRSTEVANWASSVGDLTEREILIAGAIAYWCEGSKRKVEASYSSWERVVFMNSDAGLIRFFLRFLDVAGVDQSDLVFRVHIHENADVEGAHYYWQEVTGASADKFARPTIKRHKPRTNRWNTGENYHGCLGITVHQSSGLYRKIQGLAEGAMRRQPTFAR